ncbi:MAG: LysM peptidoglycan-binding domain-containing protein [Bacteroidota bacterium]|nr:LysM peptidoglycan-binding domain-containing protein [Bacteroidota bacterium]
MQQFISRKITLLSVFLCLALSACSQTATKSTVTQTISGKKYYIHKVEKGQSLYAISKIYETDLNAIVLENPEAIDGIKPGQELKILFNKEAGTSVSSSKDFENYEIHKVAKGETIYGICKKYNVSEKDFNNWNPEAKSGLKDGQLLKVGLKAKSTNSNTVITPTQTYETYVVEKGETVYAITKKFNLNIDDFYTMNPEAKNGLSTGQIVNIGTKKTEPAITNTTTVVPTTSDTLTRPKKTEYTIGLFLPFEFNNISAINVDQLIKDKQDFPEMQTVAIDFYEGMKYAMDSLQSNDCKYTFAFYDTQERDSLQVDKIMKDEAFKKLDMIVGPMFNSTFKVVSEKAKETGIPIISPVTQHNKVLFNNPYTSKTTPSNVTLVEGLAEFVADSFKGQNVVIINSGKVKEQAIIKTFKSHYNDYLSVVYDNTKDTIGEAKGLGGAKVAYNPTKKNYYVILSEDDVYLTDLLTQLNSFIDKKKELNVIGLKKWISIDHLDPEYLNKFNFIYPSASFVNDQNPEVRRAGKLYKSKFYTDPSDYYFHGIDIGLYYLNALKESGPDFYKNLDKNRKKGMTMDFNFFRPSETTGFDNKSIQIIRYSDYQFQKIN